jgi:Uma2 family endonuclease
MPVLEKEISTVSVADKVIDHKYRLTTEQYYQMSEAGIFGDDDKRVELIDGEIYYMEPTGPMHSRGGMRLFRLFDKVIGTRFFLSHEEPVSIVDGTEPQPDLLIAKGPESAYDERHPVAEDLIVVVEVSMTSLASDRKWKSAIYAGADIPEYWIVNLVDKQVEVYRKPLDKAYSERAIYKPGEQVPLTFAGDASIAVSDFLR